MTLVPSRQIVALALVLCAFEALAQGSLIPGSAGSRPPDGGDPRSRRAAPPDYRTYEYGKEIYAVKLGCTGCPLGTEVLDEKVAKRFLSDETLWASLNDKEQAAVSEYLQKRFGL